ncbi:hypothetical protein ACWC0C_46740 [Streptomyces sp. NPDC001709]
MRLLNDPEAHVRGTAVRNPQLPARVLAGLLHDRDTACAAVTNPAIPGPRPAPHPHRGRGRGRHGSPALKTDTPHGDRGGSTLNDDLGLERATQAPSAV